MNIVLKQLWSWDLKVSSKDSVIKQAYNNKKTWEIKTVWIWDIQIKQQVLLVLYANPCYVFGIGLVTADMT